MEAKLAAMRDGRVAVVSPEAKLAAERLSLALFDEWTRRRRIFRDCYDALLESVETKPAQLKNDVRRPPRIAPLAPLRLAAPGAHAVRF